MLSVERSKVHDAVKFPLEQFTSFRKRNARFVLLHVSRTVPNQSRRCRAAVDSTSLLSVRQCHRRARLTTIALSVVRQRHCIE
jgi:hypothetical protein